MAIELRNVEVLQRAINAISSFISEGNFRFNDKGLALKALDPSQIVLVNYVAEKKLFDKFEIEPTFVGMDLIEFSKILNRLLPKDRLVLDLTDSELLVDFEGEISRNFSVPLIDVAEEEINVPETRFDCRIEILGRIFKEILKDASLFGGAVVFKIKNNDLTIEARGSSGNLKTLTKGAKGLVVKSSSDVVGKYSLNFLQNIVREADSEKKIVLELKSDSPMKVSYEIGESEISFHLAYMIL